MTTTDIVMLAITIAAVFGVACWVDRLVESQDSEAGNVPAGGRVVCRQCGMPSEGCTLCEDCWLELGGE